MAGQRGILVIGATGTIGRQVVAQALEAGAEVRAAARDPETAGLPGGAEVVRADLADPDSLRAPLDGAEAVFLLWPFATAEGMPALLDMIAAHARRVVYLSSAAVRDHERRIEGMIERSGLERTFLRPHAFAANTLRWAGQIRAEAVVREPYGAAAMPPLHERDLAAVAVRALTGDGHDGAAYELAGPETLTQAEQARVIGEVIGRPVRWEETSPRAARERMLERGWPPEAVDGVLRAQAGMVTSPRAATATVEEVTGVPARTFRAWVTDHADRFRTP
ncbi:NmrA family NAD(P)-binding protein [Streptosporangium sp. NPDC002524]|uniref:NAD(P)H-binding protein n=1 Tax=Streptosporangium sp. NPDC002524 TaxID=3154537 RepID=UPI00331ACBC1